MKDKIREMLSDEEITQILDTTFGAYDNGEATVKYLNVIKLLEAQRDDTALRMEARCQKRIEGIFEEIGHYLRVMGTADEDLSHIEIPVDDWYTLKSKALKKSEKG